VSITSSDTIGWHMQLSQGDIKFDSAVTYVLTFDASSTVANRPLNVDFSSGPGTTPAWNWLGGGSVTLGTATKSYTIEVTVKGSSSSGVLQFGLATSKAAPVTVTIDNIVLVKKTTASTGIAQIARNLASGNLKLALRGNTLSWSAPQALTTGGVVRLLDAQGRELSRTAVAAGVCGGSLAISGQGLRMVVLESAQGTMTSVIPALR